MSRLRVFAGNLCTCAMKALIFTKAMTCFSWNQRESWTVQFEPLRILKTRFFASLVSVLNGTLRWHFRLLKLLAEVLNFPCSPFTSNHYDVSPVIWFHEVFRPFFRINANRKPFCEILAQHKQTIFCAFEHILLAYCRNQGSVLQRESKRRLSNNAGARKSFDFWKYLVSRREAGAVETETFLRSKLRNFSVNFGVQTEFLEVSFLGQTNH